MNRCEALPAMRCFWICVFAISLALAWPGGSGAIEGYVLGPGDLLDIQVHPDETLGGKARVAADGTVTLALGGPVPVSGMTAEAAGDAIRARLDGRFLRAPQVTVAVVEYQSHRVSLHGAIERAGSVPLAPGDRLLDLIDRGGGLRPESAGIAFILVPGAEPQRVSTRGLLETGDFSQNLLLESGSAIYFMSRARVFVLGAVERPGAYPYEDGMTLLRAVSLAGGFAERARTGSVWLYSGGPDAPRTEVDTGRVLSQRERDPALRPGDLLVVPERFF